MSNETYNCICCGKELEEICSDDTDVFVNGGVLQLMQIGYGSIHDGLVTVAAICDDCLSEKCKLS